MPTYQYTATDSTGRSMQGAVSGTSPDDVRKILAAKGLIIKDLREVGSKQPPAPTKFNSPPSQPAPMPQRRTPAAQTPISLSGAGTPTPYQYGKQAPIPSQPSAPMRINTPTNTTKPQVRTAIGKDKDRFFIFSQLASAFRAGVAPMQIYSDVSQRSRGIFAGSFQEAAVAAQEGIPLSTVLERYPDLYPEHVVGTVRAGEIGGFLPDALDAVALQAESAHRFNRWFFWVWFLLVNFLLSIPGMWIACRTLLASWDAIDAKGGAGAKGGQMSTGEALGMTGQAMWKLVVWPWGPLTLASWLLLWAFFRYYGSRKTKRFRHKVGLKYPVFGPRARHENLQRFSWTLSRVSRAGVTPDTAWRLAADSVPNLEMRDRLHSMGQHMTGEQPLSTVMYQSKLFPDEYGPMIATAEYTGDIPGAFQRLSDVSKGEFEAAQNYAKARSGCWGLLGCFVTSAIMLGMFWYAWYVELPQKVLSGMEPPMIWFALLASIIVGRSN